MAYQPRIKQRALELIQEGYALEKVANILSKEFKDELKTPCERTIGRWRNKKATASMAEVSKTPPTNWIDDWESQCGELPLVPEFMRPVVRDKAAKRVSKNIELSIPSLQWWASLLPSQKEQVMQTVDWLSKHNKDWWCKSREDYLAMVKRLTPGNPSTIRLIPKRKMP